MVYRNFVEKELILIGLLIGIIMLVIIGTIFNKSSEKWITNKEEYIKNKELTLNKLTINSSDSLTLENVSLTMNGDIEVKEEGQLNIINSVITGNHNYEIYYHKGTKGIIDSSIIENTKLGRDTLDTGGHGGIAGVTILADDFVLKNSVIRNSEGRGVLFGACKNISVLNNTFYNNSYDGVRFYNCSDIIVENNTGYDNGEYAIKAMYSRNVTITGNIARNNERDGIHLHTSEDVVIEKNNVYDNGNNGIQVGPGLFNEHRSGCSNVVVRNNKVKGNGFIGIIFLTSPNSEISGNIVEESREYGIIVQWQSDNINVSKNIVKRNNGGGIVVLESNNVKVFDNEINNNGHIGVVFESSQNSKSSNNIIKNHGFHAGIFLYNSTGITIFNDYIENTTGCGIDMQMSNTIITNAIIKETNECDIQAREDSSASVKNCGCDVDKFHHDESSSIEIE